MNVSAAVTSKGQITLPAKVCKYLGIKSGDVVIFDFVGDQLMIRKARNIENYFNTLPPLNFSFKERLDVGDIIIAEDSKSSDISSILSFDNHFEKLGLTVISSLPEQGI
jgi:AbrB family looped-hinge helix DNA binding protein